VPAIAPPALPALETVDVRVALGGRPVLAGVSVTVGAGEVLAVTGPNGAGKSTLLAVLAGVLAPQSGAVRRAPGARVGLVPQGGTVPAHLPVTVRDVVELGRRDGLRPRRLGAADRAIVTAALDALDLAPLVARPIAELSGGQRQRALVAQGVARRADLLLLDEPTAAVDVASRELVLTAIRREAARGAAVVVVTHDEVLAGAADRVLRLEPPA
jgi:zinc/manganese transport system ATP-binding protein